MRSGNNTLSRPEQRSTAVFIKAVCANCHFVVLEEAAENPAYTCPCCEHHQESLEQAA